MHACRHLIVVHEGYIQSCRRVCVRLEHTDRGRDDHGSCGHIQTDCRVRDVCVCGDGQYDTLLNRCIKLGELAACREACGTGRARPSPTTRAETSPEDLLATPWSGPLSVVELYGPWGPPLRVEGTVADLLLLAVDDDILGKAEYGVSSRPAITIIPNSRLHEHGNRFCYVPTQARRAHPAALRLCGRPRQDLSATPRAVGNAGAINAGERPLRRRAPRPASPGRSLAGGSFLRGVSLLLLPLLPLLLLPASTAPRTSIFLPFLLFPPPPPPPDSPPPHWTK